MKQKIFSRIEFPIDGISSESIFEEFRKFEIRGIDGIITEGATVAIRSSPNRAAIILTYDEASDIYFRLKYCGMKEVKITDLRKTHG